MEEPSNTGSAYSSYKRQFGMVLMLVGCLSTLYSTVVGKKNDWFTTSSKNNAL